MADGHGFHQPSIALGPFASPELNRALDRIGDPPFVWLRCQDELSCGRHLAKLALDQRAHTIRPIHEATPAHSGRVPPWLDRANAGKGPIRPGNTADGDGTHNYRCKCGHNIELRADTRMHRYLEAVSRGHAAIWA
jgi:hypothetical protein